MDRRKIIEKVNEIGSSRLFSNTVKNSKFGKTQFRALCEMTSQMNCVEEMELLIDYKTSKGNGWNESDGNNTFGRVIKAGLRKLIDDNLKDTSKMSDSEITKLYFGYLHWKATIIKASKDY